MASIRSAVSNLWYHRKAEILFCAFVIFAVVFCLHSCVTRPEYDIEVYYVTGKATPVYSEQLEWIERSVASLCEDANGDGTVTVAVTNVKIDTGNSSEIAQWFTPVHAGTVMLFFGDETGINYLYQNGFIQQLTDYTDDLTGDGYAWHVNGSDFARALDGFDLFGETDVYAALRIFDGSWNSSKKSVKENFRIADQTLRAMVGYSDSGTEE